MRLTMGTPEQEEALFWSRANRGPGCWEWTAGRMPGGYGRWRRHGQEAYAHRQAWVLVNGPIPEGLLIRHTCDNPPCVNPAHLVLGTTLDNVHDAIGRQRRPRGLTVRGHPTPKLTIPQVLEIKRALRDGQIHRVIAAAYGVSQSTVSMIASGKNWPNVRLDD